MTGPGRKGNHGAADVPPDARHELRMSDVCAEVLSHMLNGVAYCRMLFKDGKPDDFVYLHTNPAFHAQTGLGDVNGMRVSQVIPGILESNPSLFEIYGRVASGGAPEKFQTYVEGLQHWFEIDVFSPHADHFVAVFDVITTRKSREDALQQAQERLAIAQRASGSGIWDWNIVSGTIIWSEELFSLFGVDPATEAASFETWTRAVHPDDRLAAEERIFSAVRDHSQLSSEYRILRPSGEERWIGAHGDTAYDARGQPLRMTGICLDITDRKRSEVRLRLAATVFAHSYDGIVVTDKDDFIIDVNPAFTRITGYSRDEVLGLLSKLSLSGRHDTELHADMVKSLEAQDSWTGEIWCWRKNGEPYLEMRKTSVVRDQSGRVENYIAFISDVTRAKAHEAELDRIAHYDPLTGVANRRLLVDRLNHGISHAQREGTSLAVCYLDLDGFKPINDQHGHDAGDRLLVAIAERLGATLRGEDTVARLGGDEFVLLFNDLDGPDDAHELLERLLSIVVCPLPIGLGELTVSASIGATIYPADMADADTLLRHADQAMYRAKYAGKNQYCVFDTARDRKALEQIQHLQRLREAFEGKEFVLHFQPKVDLITGIVVGVEALIRWQRVDLGLVLPGAFLHFLHGSDLEVTIGQWVLESVLERIEDWNALGLSIAVSANISAEHLLHSDFAEHLEQALKRHRGVAPSQLELEILETTTLSDMARATHVLSRCRQLGVSIALDDFGTGYSSLTYFRKLPVQTLKIDQSFVRDMLDDPDSFGIVESVVRLANAFNRRVIAEGVETLEHGARLVQMGCSLVQGDGVARPMPAEQIPAWVQDWRVKARWKDLNLV